jgi:deoxyribose-phosphate aldolase
MIYQENDLSFLITRDIYSLSYDNIASICDHTFLKRVECYKDAPNPIKSRKEEFNNFLLDVTKRNLKPYALCIRPEDISYTKYFLDNHNLDLRIASVVGFPEGSYCSNLKYIESMFCISKGVDEIDMVMNYNSLKENKLNLVSNEIRTITKLCHNNNVILKVILEVSELDSIYIEKASKICEEEGVDFIKTSTGFSSRGADSKSLYLMRINFSRGIKISGGVNLDNVYDLLYASNQYDSIIRDFNPMKLRIGESSLLKQMEEKYTILDNY